MKYNQYTFEAKVWLYPGMAGWHFVSLPKDLTEEINDRFGDQKRGWGSLPVIVTIGATTWKTSIFPDKKTATFLMPLKSDVRKKEGIVADQTRSVFIEISV